MDKDFERTSAASPTPDNANQSAHTDLQYVSLQMDGKTYGGWYRVLPDGRMELLALANMHSERRPENTPIEQASGMLADFVRAARPNLERNEPSREDANIESHALEKDRRESTTLGDLLYADRAAPVSEEDWVAIVRSIAAGDQSALHRLFERTHRIVFTLILRLADNREAAEKLTVDVYHELWRDAHRYDAVGESVLGWIMNQTRSAAIDQSRVESRERRPQTHDDGPYPVNAPSEALWKRLAQCIAAETGVLPIAPAVRQWTEPTWKEVAPGISCNIFASDAENDRVSMLVRLAPGVEYPPHTHAGVEELYLLDGELLIDDRTLTPGDYNRAEAGTADKRVFSETGCTCVLMTSSRDEIA